MIQKITQNNWNFWTVNLIMRAKKLSTSHQIFRYAVPARTVTKKHWLQASEMFAKLTLALAQNCRVHFAKSSLNTCVPVNSSTLQSRDKLTILFKHRCDDTHTQPFNGPLSGITQVGQYQKKHSSTHNHPHHQTSFINFLYLVCRRTGSTW